jgi:hypothetical protein
MSKQEPEFFKKMTQGNKTYELYLWDDPEAARKWLMTKEVTEPLYYIQVKTEQGVWGIDKEGLFLTDLLPWQTNLALAKHEGEITGMPNMFNLGMVAQGITDNFVVEVQCGSEGCSYTWMDGIRYQDKTVVRCPQCREYSLIDSKHIHAL